MRLNKVGNLATQLGKENRGYILTMSVLIISAIISIVVIGTSLSSLIVLDKNNEDLKGVEIKHYTQGCMEEALIQVNRDSDYSGGTYDIGSGTCEISTSGPADSKEISTTGTLKTRTYNLQAKVNTDNFEILSWGD